MWNSGIHDQSNTAFLRLYLFSNAVELNLRHEFYTERSMDHVGFGFAKTSCSLLVMLDRLWPFGGTPLVEIFLQLLK